MYNNFSKSKYKNTWTKTEDGSFASKGELARWNFLKMMQDMGRIKNLRRQIRFKLIVDDQLICTYVADHGYVLAADAAGNEIIEDFKGLITPDCAIKLKLMRAIHGIEVRLVKKPTADYK